MPLYPHRSRDGRACRMAALKPGDSAVLLVGALGELLQLLRTEGYQLVGPPGGPRYRRGDLWPASPLSKTGRSPLSGLGPAISTPSRCKTVPSSKAHSSTRNSGARRPDVFVVAGLDPLTFHARDGWSRPYPSLTWISAESPAWFGPLLRHGPSRAGPHGGAEDSYGFACSRACSRASSYRGSADHLGVLADLVTQNLWSKHGPRSLTTIDSKLTETPDLRSPDRRL